MLDKIIYGLMLLTAFLTPIFWLSRDLVVLLLVPIMLLLYLVKVSRDKKAIFQRTPLDYVLLGFLLVYFLSAYFSLNRYASFWAATGMLMIVLFYWLAVSNLNQGQARKLLGAMTLSGAVAAIGFWARGLGLVKQIPASLLGTQSALVSFLALLVAVSIYFILRNKFKLLNILFILLSISVIATVNFKIGWNILIAGAAIWLVVLIAKQRKSASLWLILPLLILSLGLTWRFFDLGSTYNLKLPIEVSLGHKSSLEIAKDSVHSNLQKALLGSGPGTFQYDFSQERPINFNQSALWQLRFSQASNQFIETWATTGYLGLISLLLIILIGLILSWHNRRFLPVLLSMLVVAWYAVLSSPFWLLLMLVLFLAIPQDAMRQVKIVLAKNSNRALVTSFGFVLGVIVVVLFLGYLTKVYLADYYYAQGKIEQAIKYNPNQAWYYLSLAQDSLARALKTEDSQQAAALISAAINGSQRAVELSPNNVALWQGRADIFKQARLFTPDANEWVISTLNQAIKLEPTNPMFYRDLGVAYELSKDKAKALDNFQQAVDLKPDLAVNQYELGRFYYNDDNMESAIKHLEQAVLLSPSYANALFSLGLAYEKEKRNQEALVLMKRVLELNPDNQAIAAKVKQLEPSKKTKEKLE